MVEISSKLQAEEQAAAFIQILEKDPQDRTDQDIDQIVETVQDNKSLKQFKGTRKIKDLCR